MNNDYEKQLYILAHKIKALKSNDDIVVVNRKRLTGWDAHWYMPYKMNTYWVNDIEIGTVIKPFLKGKRVRVYIGDGKMIAIDKYEKKGN